VTPIIEKAIFKKGSLGKWGFFQKNRRSLESTHANKKGGGSSISGKTYQIKEDASRLARHKRKNRKRKITLKKAEDSAKVAGRVSQFKGRISPTTQEGSRSFDTC